MKVSGTAHLTAERAAVFRALHDPAVLQRAIPGCERLERLGDNLYAMTVTAGVASVRGAYQGQVRRTDADAPASFRLHAQGAGAPGTIGADVLVTLSDAHGGGTDLAYDAEAVVGGMVGGVGQRMLTGVSKKLAGEFFGNVEAVLSGKPPAVAVPPAASTAEAAGVLPVPPRALVPTGSEEFRRGLFVGGALVLAGVAVGGLIGRRAR